MIIFNYHTNLYKRKTNSNKEYACINDFFDKIYVIALPEHIEQKSYIESYFNKYNLSFSFFDGINGYNDSELIDIYNNYIAKPLSDESTHPVERRLNRKLIKSPAALGLLKTYKHIIEYSIKKKHNNILIFEDDVIFDTNLQEKLLSFLNSVTTDYDMLYLGCSHHMWNNPNILQIPNTTCNYYKAPTVIDGSFATAYNSKIFNLLLSEINNFNAPIDLCLRSITKNNNSYILYPNIAVAETTRKSSISNISRNLRYHHKNVRWNLSELDFSRGILKTSILIANYNSENTIRYTLDSIKKQIYPNTETIIVDDNSIDSSVSIIKEWMNHNKNVNVTLIELNNNIGAYKCRNIALDNSEGFFVTILDSDDIFLDHKILNDIYNYFNNTEYEIFFSTMYRSQSIDFNKFHDQNILYRSIEEERLKHRKSHNQTENDYDWDYRFRFGLPTIFVEKEFFTKYGKWREDFRYGMDIELIQRYIANKYNKYISNKDLYVSIGQFNAKEYGIFCDSKMNYVSFPMNKNNATNICTKENRSRIHSICNQDIKQLLTKDKNSVKSI